MPERSRPDPDAILKSIAEDDKKQKAGKLKIFFGYAAGVGKTYAMLEAAHDALAQGVDVVAGYIEPHTRPDTMALLEGLECLPNLEVQHHNIVLREFDLDAALKRHPQVILVDELAHSNAEECRHVKRYQDVEELLKAGISVYTTVNVQHIESLNDIVASITGVIVRERIPDHVFDNADQVELVDIEPEELLLRLTHGKIYRGPQAERAKENFFSVENLVSLREIALRRTADRVNRLSERKKQKSDYYTEEHILICLSPSPTNAKVIRTASRMANAFKGTFTALFVETSDFRHISEKDRDGLRANLKLAEQLGARIATVYGDDVPMQIAEFARVSGVSKIILGRTNTKRRFFFTRPSFADRLTVLAPNLDIYIIPEKVAQPYKPGVFRKKAKTVFTLRDLWRMSVILAVTTLVAFGFQALHFSDTSIITLYILGTLLTAVVTVNIWYSLLASLLSVLLFNFCFTSPVFSLLQDDPGYVITFLVMFVAAFITGSLTTRIQQQATRSAQMAYRTQILLDTNQKLEKADDADSIIEETATQLLKLVGKPVIFYKVTRDGLSGPQIFPVPESPENTAVYVSNSERAVAQWVYKNNKHAGATTNTLPGSKCLYLAVRGENAVYAVVAIALGRGSLDTFDNSLLMSMLGECALALEKCVLNENRKEAGLKAQQERLRANLLRSISHDLRTPLTSISGNAGVLLSSGESLEPNKRRQLYSDIYDDSMWLITLVENLLSVTRIEDGTMNIHMQGELVSEVIAAALNHVDRKKSEHDIRLQQVDDLLLARMDSRLIVQVIINIVDNAIKYTPAGSHIDISARREGKFAVVEIADDGPGIADEDKPHIFEMFYSGKTAADSRRGLGLGLALCKSIVSAHGGTIAVRDNQPQGSVFSFSLQAEEAKALGQ